MINALKFTIPASIVSGLVFYFLFKKLGIVKLLNNNKRRIIAIIISFILDIIGLIIIGNFSVTKEYHDLFTGLFMGPIFGIMPFVHHTNNSKTKS